MSLESRGEVPGGIVDEATDRHIDLYGAGLSIGLFGSFLVTGSTVDPRKDFRMSRIALLHEGRPAWRLSCLYLRCVSISYRDADRYI
ncbi:hypothetical protein [Methylobacterium sp. SyP6R]|uniref:hypothetical protein n=1 Tax=Methylobacterium sp. SyP6R TaxID=2718876 RepID=UPI001F3215CC|nr:hypothetical protein [Methylobacterium sp. SyP6R]MCF4128761.1 hypothetical protein [Methylobacterium sp. SyP6R]